MRSAFPRPLPRNTLQGPTRCFPTRHTTCMCRHSLKQVLCLHPIGCTSVRPLQAAAHTPPCRSSAAEQAAFGAEGRGRRGVGALTETTHCAGTPHVTDNCTISLTQAAWTVHVGCQAPQVVLVHRPERLASRPLIQSTMELLMSPPVQHAAPLQPAGVSVKALLSLSPPFMQPPPPLVPCPPCPPLKELMYTRGGSM